MVHTRRNAAANIVGCHTMLKAMSGLFRQAQSAAMPEPTVTVNTREAWAAINGMFSSALPHETADATANLAIGANGPVAAAPRPPLPRRASVGAGV